MKYKFSSDVCVCSEEKINGEVSVHAMKAFGRSGDDV